VTVVERCGLPRREVEPEDVIKASSCAPGAATSGTVTAVGFSHELVTLRLEEEVNRDAPVAVILGTDPTIIDQPRHTTSTLHTQPNIMVTVKQSQSLSPSPLSSIKGVRPRRGRRKQRGRWLLRAKGVKAPKVKVGVPITYGRAWSGPSVRYGGGVISLHQTVGNLGNT
jgi:hypothetical protein